MCAVQCLYDFNNKQWRWPSGIAAGRYRHGSPYGTIAPSHMEVMTAFTNNVSAYLILCTGLLSCNRPLLAKRHRVPVRAPCGPCARATNRRTLSWAMEGRTGSHRVNACT